MTKKVLDSKIKMSIMAKRMAAKQDLWNDFFLTKTDNELFYDDFSDLFFYSNRLSVMGAEMALNREFAETGVGHLSTFYDILIPNYPEVYKKYGWTYDSGFVWIDVEHIWIDEPFMPNEGYGEYYMLVFTDLPEKEVV